jgi:hypothetical protein
MSGAAGLWKAMLDRTDSAIGSLAVQVQHHFP